MDKDTHGPTVSREQLNRIKLHRHRPQRSATVVAAVMPTSGAFLEGYFFSPTIFSM